MSTNQNTTQENLKKCSKKKKSRYKYLTILAVIIVLSVMLCINASALVLQNVSEMKAVYPSLIMYIPYIDENNNTAASLVEVSGTGKDDAESGVWNEIYFDNGNYIVCQILAQQYQNVTNNQLTSVITADYTSYMPFTYLYTSNPININIWEWSQEYEDNIIWQLWDYSQINSLTASYEIEIPYFNNSAIMGTEPLVISIEREIQSNIIRDSTYTYDIEIPDIDEIINKTIEQLENESQSEITFQYKGNELQNNNYVTNVYVEDGAKITIDFKKALSTILVNIRMSFNENSSESGITRIGIVNYNDYSVNDEISHLRTNDFRKLAIENEFTRSAEITMERQEKDVRILNWLGNAIAGIMNVEIFPNFSLGGLLSVIVMIPIILWILKLVAGG